MARHLLGGGLFLYVYRFIGQNELVKTAVTPVFMGVTAVLSFLKQD